MSEFYSKLDLDTVWTPPEQFKRGEFDLNSSFVYRSEVEYDGREYKPLVSAAYDGEGTSERSTSLTCCNREPPYLGEIGLTYTKRFYASDGELLARLSITPRVHVKRTWDNGESCSPRCCHCGQFSTGKNC